MPSAPEEPPQQGNWFQNLFSPAPKAKHLDIPDVNDGGDAVHKGIFSLPPPPTPDGKACKEAPGTEEASDSSVMPRPETPTKQPSVHPPPPRTPSIPPPSAAATPKKKPSVPPPAPAADTDGVVNAASRSNGTGSATTGRVAFGWEEGRGGNGPYLTGAPHY